MYFTYISNKFVLAGQIMTSRLTELFEDEKLVKRIKRKLPYLFQLAELESSQAGKVGMEVGVLFGKKLSLLCLSINSAKKMY